MNRCLCAAAAAASLAAGLAACGAEGYIVDQVASSGVTPAPTSTGGSSTPPASTTPTSQNSGGTTTDPSDSTDPTSSTDPTTTPTTPTTSSCSATTDTYSNYISALFASNCQSCHGQKYGTLANITANQASIRGQVSSGAMPPSSFSASDKMRVLTWLNCPAPLP